MYNIEKQIKAYINKHFTNLSLHEKNLIIKGYRSILKSKYNINIDICEELIAFRSEYDLDRKSCFEEEKLKKEADVLFYKKLQNDELAYQGEEEYKKILFALKCENLICKECKINNHKNCPIDTSNDSINNELKNREKMQFHKTQNILNFHETMMSQIREAVNNETSIYRSYSKYLAAPLFKYANDGHLYIKRLTTNTADVEFIISLHDWFDSENPYSLETIESTIPLRGLASKETLCTFALQDMDTTYKDIDNIELIIKGVTIDISKINRTSFNDYYTLHSERCMKALASYKKDQEILTTDTSSASIIIKNKRIIQLIRFLYLLKISSYYTKSVEDFVNAVITGEYPEIMMNDDDHSLFMFIYNYLDNKEIIANERIQYHALYSDGDLSYKFKYKWNEPKGIIHFFEHILSTPVIYDGIFEHDFLQLLLKETKIKDI